MTISALPPADTENRDPDTGETETHELRLKGCSPTPLAHYLKALAVLRIIARQVDTSARGWWCDGYFVLRTHLDETELVDFFANDYEPTPIASPWNGGSGFKPNKIRDEVRAIRESRAARLSNYREVVETTFALLEELGIEGKVKKKQKEDFLAASRSRFPAEALPWLDAAVVLTGEGPRYPAVLGTGGNDGRLEFGLNFMRRLDTVFDYYTGAPTSRSADWLRASLFQDAQIHLQTDAAIGQFFPYAAGGTNQTTGFDADTISNPWDYIFMLEGAVFFAAAAVKRLESTGRSGISVPFSVRHVGVGHASTDTSEEADARDELWVPLWEKPATARQLHALMSEGRARIGRQTARDGLDFARAVATLGVDRGITEFHRYGFQQRNGRAYFATPLNRIRVQRRPHVELIDDIDGWLDTLSRSAHGDGVPGSIQSVTRNLQEAIFRLCQYDDPGRVRDVLVCLGACERQLAHSFDWSVDNRIPPLSGLSPRWLQAGDDGTPEFRLAASLASVYGKFDNQNLSIRTQFEPVRHTGHGQFGWKEQVDRDVVWHEGNPVEALGRVMNRRILHAVQSSVDTWPDTGRIPASLRDISAFVEGRVDEQRMTDLLWGMLAIDTSKLDEPPFEENGGRAHPGVLFALTKLCFAGVRRRNDTDQKGEDSGSSLDELAQIPVVPKIHRHLLDGNCLRATRAAVHRLRADQLSPVVDQFDLDDRITRRCAAALLFPLSPRSLWQLRKLVLRNQED